MILRMSSSTFSPNLPAVDALVIRPAYPDDASTLVRLAALDSQRPLAGSVVVAERGGRVLAAIALDDGRTIGDPFAPTADLVALLRLHAADTARRFAGRPDLLPPGGASTR